jgi:hypothetical protein
MINTKDMARALEWGIPVKKRMAAKSPGGVYRSNDWSNRILALAEATAKVIPGVKIQVNPEAPPINFKQG